MGKVITFINEKGGIGKTSCCFNTAWELSKKKKILLIDMDGQRANLTFFCGIKKENGMKTIFHILSDEESINDVKVEVKKNLDLVPANSIVSELSQNLKIIRMLKAIDEVKDDYDFIFIDVNPTPNRSHALSLSVSDFIIIPMLPDVASLEANNGITESVEEILLTSNSNLKVLGILFNKYESRSNMTKQVNNVAEKMAENLKSSVFKTKIRKGVASGENVNAHIGITEYAPSSNVAKDYVEFCKEFLRKVKKEG